MTVCHAKSHDTHRSPIPRSRPPPPTPAPRVSRPQVRKRLGDEAADHLVGKEGHQALKVSAVPYMYDGTGSSTGTTLGADRSAVVFHT